MIKRDDDFSFQVTTKQEEDVMEIVTRLFNSIKSIRDKHGLLLGVTMRNLCTEALQSMAVLNPKFNPTEDTNDDFVPHYRENRQRRQRDSVTVADIQQVVFREQFSLFATQLTGNAQTLYHDGIILFETMPLVIDGGHKDVRLEPLLKKLSQHVRSMIKRNGVASRSLDNEVVATTAWLIKTWRLLLEKHLGIEMEVYCKSDFIGIVVNETAMKFQRLFNSCGVTYLCLELISVGIEHSLVIEAIYLLIALLIGTRGNEQVQSKVAKYFVDTDCTLLFQELGEILEQLTLWSSREFEQKEESKIIPALPEEISIFKLIQLLCEGNYAPCQNFIRDQSGNSRSISLVNQLATYSDTLSRLESHLCTQMSIHLIQCIHSLLQGPCKGNQDQFVLQTELLLSLNRVLRAPKPLHDSTPEWLRHIERLKECSVDVLRAAIEDQPQDSVILERVATTIELNVLHVLILPAEGHHHRSHPLSPLQYKYLVFRHTLRQKTRESAFSLAMTTGYAKAISCIEVVWNGEVHRHYFHIPAMVDDLSPLTKEMLYSAMDSATHEMQLRGFLRIARDLYIEATNHRALRHYGFGNIGSWRKLLLRTMFLNAIIMNLILIMYFVKKEPPGLLTDVSPNSVSTDDHNRFLVDTAPVNCVTASSSRAFNYMQKGPKDALVILNCLQIFLAFATVVILALVRIPTTFKSNTELGLGYFNSVLRTISDPIPLWYVVYLLFAFLGLLYNPLFLCALLLDFVVIDSTTRDVLFAVTDPVRQLLSTLALICIVAYIFAAIIFQAYWTDIISFTDNSLWDTLKVAVFYGVRGEYGVSHEMTPTLGERVILDIAFYILVLEILRSVFHAIIIDGFGKLRELKVER